MASVEYMKWEQRSKLQRWEAWRAVLSVPWNGDRGWEGRTIGLHLPMNLRNFAVAVQEKQGLQSMKEVLFKALVIGLRELDGLPPVLPPSAPVKPKVQGSCERCGDPRDAEGSNDRLCALCVADDDELLPEPPTKPIAVAAPLVAAELCSKCGNPFDPSWSALWCWTSGAAPTENVCQRCADDRVVES